MNSVLNNKIKPNLCVNTENHVSFEQVKSEINLQKFKACDFFKFLRSDAFKKTVNEIFCTENHNNIFKKRRIYTLNIQQWERLFKINFVNASPLRVREIYDGYILPTNKISGYFAGGVSYAGGVIDSENKYIAGFKRHRSRKCCFSCEDSYEFDHNVIENSRETVIFGGVLVNHFGHFMLEGFSRLWYIISHPSALYRYRIAFCTINGTAPWFDNFLDLVGISIERIIFIDKVTRFSKIIIPDEAIMSWDQIHPEYFLPYNYMISNAKKLCNNFVKFEKLYLSKSSYSAGCKCIGEEYFEKFFRNKGFKILYPEKVSIVEMIYLISNAKEIVSTLGTLSHYFLFANESCKVVTLTRTHDDTLYPQALINSVKNLDYYIVDVSQNFFYANRSAGVSLLGVTQCWKDFVQEQYNEIVNDETDSKFVFEYLKSFYQMYKNKSQFKLIDNKGMTDVFKRMGTLFFGEVFKIENTSDKNTDFFNSSEYYKYQLLLVKENSKLVNHVDDRLYLKYSGHFSGEGDSSFVIENSVLGSTVKFNRIEGITIDFINKDNYAYLKYSVFCANKWTNFVNAGSFCGTTGKSIPITGIQIVFSDSDHNPPILKSVIQFGQLQYSLKYRIFNSSKIWSEWVNNGEKLYSSDNREIYAVQIRLISVC